MTSENLPQNTQNAGHGTLVAAQPGSAPITQQLVLQYLADHNQHLTDMEKAQFLSICETFQLNPVKREVYAVKYKDQFSIVMGYEIYLKRAERIGNLDGWECRTTGSLANDDLVAEITIYRKDRRFPFRWQVSFAECARQTPLWKQMPTHMLKKVAIAQGFRLCFPDEMGGLPYTSDEMDGEKGGDGFHECEILDDTPAVGDTRRSLPRVPQVTAGSPPQGAAQAQKRTWEQTMESFRDFFDRQAQRIGSRRSFEILAAHGCKAIGDIRDMTTLKAISDELNAAPAYGSVPRAGGQAPQGTIFDGEEVENG